MTYLLRPLNFWLVPAVALLGLTACTIDDPPVEDSSEESSGDGDGDGDGDTGDGDGDTGDGDGDTGDGDTGDGDAGNINPEACEISTVVSEPGNSKVRAVAAHGQGFVLGTDYDSFVRAIDLEGETLWEQGVGKIVRSVTPRPDGGVFVAADTDDGPVVAGLSSAGEPEWSTSLGWPGLGPTEVVALEGGEHLVSWDGDSNRIILARVDAAGEVLWAVDEYNVKELSHADRSTMAVLPDGSVLQMTLCARPPRLLHRASEDGALLAEIEVDAGLEFDPDATPELELTPMDLLALPDGSIFLLVRHSQDGSILLEINLEGEVLASHSFGTNSSPWLTHMSWDPTHEHLYLAAQSWRLITTRNGEALYELVDVDTPTASRTDVTAMPGGGFVESSWGDGLQVHTLRCPGLGE